MESGQKFKFTQQELKKINLMLPKGFKFVTKEQILKKEAPPKGAPRKKQFTPPLSESVTPPQPKVKIQREQEYQPEKKVVVRPPPQAVLIQPDEEPAGTSLKLIQRLKRHPGYLHLTHFQKINQAQITLKQIQDKAIRQGQNYRIPDLEAELNAFFLMVYRYSVKTSSDYRQAAQLQNHLSQLLKIQRAGDLKRADTISRANLGKKRAPPVKVYQPLASYKPATALQKRQLGMMIRKLSSQNLQQVIYIMFESTEVKEYTFDLDNIHIKKFRELEQFVKKCMQKAADWDPKMLEDEQFSNESQFIIENDDS